METVLFDLDFVGSREEVEFVVGDGGKLVVDGDASLFGVGGEAEEAGTLESAFFEVGAIAFGELDSYKRA